MSSFWNIGEIDTRRSLPASPSSRRLYVAMCSRGPWRIPRSGTFVAAFDGVAQLWFDDIDGFLEYLQSPNYKDGIRLDEEKFTDPRKVQLLFSEEKTIIG
jgi:hypothetical protein